MRLLGFRYSDRSFAFPQTWRLVFFSRKGARVGHAHRQVNDTSAAGGGGVGAVGGVVHVGSIVRMEISPEGRD